MNYKQLISEKNFLKVQYRARLLSMGSGTDLYAIYYNEQELVFKTKSGTYKNVIWTQRIRITDDLVKAVVEGKKFSTVENLIKYTNIKVFCNCPAFLYWGFKYKAWKKGYGLEKELRRPVVRNPREQGALCKHLYLVLQLFPFLAKPLASKFMDHYKSIKEKEQEINSNMEKAIEEELNK